MVSNSSETQLAIHVFLKHKSCAREYQRLGDGKILRLLKRAYLVIPWFLIDVDTLRYHFDVMMWP